MGLGGAVWSDVLLWCGAVCRGAVCRGAVWYGVVWLNTVGWVRQT